MTKSWIMKNLIFVFLLLSISFSCTKQKLKIACVGDSITQGAGISWESKYGYPVQLDSLLSKNYEVLNCGRSAATMLKKGDLPYWTCNEFSNVFAYSPAIIVIKLGTNDTKPWNWNAENFTKDFQSMIDTYQTIQPKPAIYLCLPVPVFKTKWGINDSTINAGVIPTIKELAAKNNLEIIDLNTVFLGKAEYFPDSIHPNEAGAKIMAEVVAEKIKKSNLAI